ncbi:MAG: XrtA/PEP-CTERM system amidotransferase [Stellaceae bacterium]
MCGIAGIFDFRGTAEIDGSLLRRMTEAIRHRGPDGDGLHIEPGLGLGHRRLSIIDLAGGRQPMDNEDGSVIVVFNGEIYDYQPLRRSLESAGHVFRTRSDTETIVHAWEAWGVDCVKHLSGMFAFALWDRKRQQLFLARDHLGKKPLYYSRLIRGQLIFASELCGLLVHPSVSRALAPTAVEDYFTYGYVPDPQSIYAGIAQLPAGHYLLLQRGEPLPVPTSYWQPRFGSIDISADEASEQLLQRLDQCVKRRLVADVPLGAFLSGGIDSGTIVALMARQRNDPIATFTIGLGGEADETPLAASVATRYATAHTAEQVGIDYIDASARQAAIFGEPFADSSAVPTHQVARLARRSVTVALSGDGGDEVFAGYRRYQWHLIVEAMRRFLPASVRRHAVGNLARLYPKLDRAPRWLRAKYTLTELSLDSALGYYRTVARVEDEERRRLMSPDFLRSIEGYHPSSRITRLMGEAGSDEPLAQAQYADMKTWLSGDILTKLDRTSMANSLEVRAPLLDHTLVSWAMRLPRSLLVRGGERKYVLRRAARQLLPEEILDHPKQGFARSLRSQFRGAGAARVRERLLGETMMDCGYFKGSGLSRCIDEHDRGTFDHSEAIWSLLVFEGFLANADRRATFSEATESVGVAAGV